MNGDILTALDYGQLLDVHRESGNVLTIASHRRVVRTEYGVLHLDDGRAAGETQPIVGFEEKPELPYVVSMGVYVMEPRALDYIEPGAHLDLPDLVLRLLDERRAGGLVPLRGLLARHRPARGLRAGDPRVRVAEGRAATPADERVPG